MSEKHRHSEFIGYKVYLTQRSIARSLEATLMPFNQTPVQWNALNQLESGGPMTQRELANRLRKEPATIARSIDRLEAKGLVRRTNKPNDRRAYLIEVTPEADELLTQIEPHVVEQANRIAEGISDEELEAFFRVLDRISANAERVSSEAASAD